MSFTLDFTYPFYEGVGSSSDTPQKFDVALNGRGYMLDTEHSAFQTGIQTIPLIRQQADTSTEPGESTINPEDLWPRGQTTWHKGAGQKYLDAPNSDRARFRSSVGIDIWEKGRLSLLPNTEAIVTSANVNLQVIRVGDYLYYSDGNDVKFRATPYSSATDTVIQNGESAQSVKSICSDGYNVYAALGSNGVHKTTRAASSTTHYSDLSCTLVAYVKGRLMAANGNAIYNVVASGAAPSALLTHPNSDFKWVAFAEGQSVIYSAGYSGDKSIVYRTAVKADGTGLDTPIVAGELPDGEIVRSVQGYLGFLIVGTDLGFRIARQDATGNLTLGARVNTDNPVRSFEPQESFIWYALENYDAARTGLGRMDLRVVTEEGAPAYATDLMAGSTSVPVQGQVLSIATDIEGKRVFAVSGKGFYLESDDLLSSGSLDSGQIGFGIPDPKIALRTALKHKPLPTGGSVTVYVEPDDDFFVFVGTSDTEASTSPLEAMKVPELAAQLFEVRVELVGGAELEEYDFRAYPVSARGEEILVPILLYEYVDTATGDKVPVDVRAEYDAIKSYEGARRLIGYQELGSTFSVFVEGAQLERHHPTEDRSWWNGTLVLKLKVLGD